MPTAIQPVLIEGPGGGLITHVNPRHVPQTAWVDGRNIRFPAAGTHVKKTDGYKKVDIVVPVGHGTEHGTDQTQIEPIRAIWDYISPSQTRHRLVQITLTGAWHGLGSDRENFNDINAPAATLDDVVSIDQYREKLIWTDGLRTLQWDGFLLASTLGVPTPTDGMEADPTGKIVEVHKDHIILANITKPKAQPWRLHWSAIGKPNVWSQRPGMPPGEAGTAGFKDFVEDNAEIMAAKVLGDHVIVHKPSRLYRMMYVSEPDMYHFEQIPGDDGALSIRSPLSIGSYQYYMGRRNFYRLASFTEPIGDATWPRVEPTIDWNRAKHIYAYRRQEFDEVCWKIPQLNNARDLTAAYNFRSQSWTLTNHDPGTCFAEVSSVLLPPPSIPPDPTVPHPPLVRGTFGQATGAIQVYGGVDADGSPVHAWLESRHFQTGLLPSKILAVPLFATGTGTLTVRLRAAMEARQPLSDWPSAHPSLYFSLDPSRTRPWLDVRAFGRLWQIRLESAALGDDWRVDAYGVAIIPGDYAR